MNIRFLKELPGRCCRSAVRSIIGLSIMLISCDSSDGPRFRFVGPDQSGITFNNQLTETPDLNIFNYLYYYNGGGVGIGDFNGDGLPDIYFTANQTTNKLYLNQGGFQFKDITDVAGVPGPENWNTGVSVADVNGDGLLDIYVSTVGNYLKIQGRNHLYINTGNNADGIPVFEEKATEYGLGLIGFSTQAAFLDYDLDGDLDMYMLNHSVHSNGTFGRAKLREETHPLAGDKFLRNDNNRFVDVTEETGIYSSALGYGLGITVSDIDEDGFPDLYIGNDFHENDYLYINNGDGTFSEQLQLQMQHTGRFSMGNDVADINNDGLLDIVSLDMLPKDYEKLKASAGEDAYDVYNYKLKYGYGHQFARNTLQLNRGNGKFSEVGMLLGIHATDWSWSGLFADFDLNGYNDLFVANGIKGRTNDMDYIKFISNEAIQYRLSGDMSEAELDLTNKMPVVKIPNYIYANNGNLNFSDVSREWGLDRESFSNGAAYADFDRDGDLDLVINNINEPAFLYRNNTVENGLENYLSINLQGDKPNPFALGAKVRVYVKEHTFTRELDPVRGYLSSVDYTLSVGLGNAGKVDSLRVIWPDQTYSVLRNVSANQFITVRKDESAQDFKRPARLNTSLFQDVTSRVGVNFRHVENDFVEFNRERLIPHMLSDEGPCLSVGDINQDGLEDFFVGAAKRYPPKVYIQTREGTFKVSDQPELSQDSVYEDVSSLLLDFDGDGDPDLLVASGGNEYRGNSEYNQPRLYINKSGLLERNRDAFPDIYLNAAVVAASDYDRDGDLDIFLGARSVQWNYGHGPVSYLLKNDGSGRFQSAPDVPDELRKAGMVRDAVWKDLNNDQQPDLVVVGEWEPIKVFINNSGVLEVQEATGDLATSAGWWSSVLITDVNEDGYPDIVAGNLGMNSKLKADADHPLTLFVADFDENGKTDPILTYYEGDKLRLFPTRDEVSAQLVSLKKTFTDYQGFANAEFYDILPESKLEKADKLYANELKSCVFINNGGLNFKKIPLPLEGQLSPIDCFVEMDLDQDQKEDVLGGGNKFSVNIQRGRYDASYGVQLVRKDGELSYYPNQITGLYLEGEIRDMDLIKVGEKKHLIVARNNDSLRVFSIEKESDKP